MDFSLTEEQQALADLSGKILTDRSTLARLKALEQGGECIDRETWKTLAEAGLIGAAIPEEYGGSGYGLIELCLMLEHVGRAVAHVPMLPTLVAGALPIAEFGSAEQKKRLLPRVASGEALLTAALIESASEPLEPITVAQRDGSGFRLDGVKISVPIAAQSEVVLVPARVDGGGVAVFLVDPRSAGVSLEREITGNWEEQHRMALEGVRVDAASVLGSVERGGEVLAWIVDRVTVGLCAIASGVGQSAMRITAEYASTRKQFDKPIATFQAVSQRLANCFIDNEAMNLAMWQAATRLAEGMPSAKEIDTAKIWAGEGGSRIGHAGLHIHGGIGIDIDYPIQRYFLWAKHLELTLGGATPHLVALGARIAGEP